jgi:hypothetical protein
MARDRMSFFGQFARGCTVSDIFRMASSFWRAMKYYQLTRSTKPTTRAKQSSLLRVEMEKIKTVGPTKYSLLQVSQFTCIHSSNIVGAVIRSNKKIQNALLPK